MDNVLDKFLKNSLLVEVSNLNEALLADKSGVDGVLLINNNESIFNNNIKYNYNIEEILNIKEKISIPLIVKCDIGNFMYAKILESFDIKYIYESPTNNNNNIVDYIQKKNFKTPFICSASNFNDALLRINEGCYILNIEMENKDYYTSLNILKEIFLKINDISSDFQKGVDIGLMKYYTNNHNIDEAIIVNMINFKKLPCYIYLSGNILTPLDIIFILNTKVDGIIISNDIFKFQNSYKILSLNKLAFSNYNNIDKIKEIIKISDPIISHELKNLHCKKNIIQNDDTSNNNTFPNIIDNLNIKNNDLNIKNNDLLIIIDELKIKYEALQQTFLEFKKEKEDEKKELEQNIVNTINLIKNNLN